MLSVSVVVEQACPHVGQLKDIVVKEESDNERRHVVQGKMVWLRSGIDLISISCESPDHRRLEAVSPAGAPTSFVNK